MTAKEAASLSPDSVARRFQDGFYWIWNAKFNEGFRAIYSPANFDDWLFKRLTEEEIQTPTDWQPFHDRQFRKRCQHER